jgi:hypothetical protein
VLLAAKGKGRVTPGFAFFHPFSRLTATVGSPFGVQQSVQGSGDLKRAFVYGGPPPFDE